MEETSNLIAARSFARSLNILLKTVRLYGVDHERTTMLFEAAWEDLCAALKLAGEGGLLLGVTGAQVLLDGVPLEKRPTDRSFAQLLTSAGLASINFSLRVTIDDFWRFVRAFSARSPQAGPMAADLSAALGGEKGTIRVNEVRFVAQDPSLGDAAMAAQIAARTLGSDAMKLQSVLKDPQRLLQLIAAAEGARSQPGSPGGQGKPGGSGGTGVIAALGPPGGNGQIAPPQEDDVFQVLRWLARLGETAEQGGSPEQVESVEQDLHQLAPPGQAALAQALMSMSSQAEPPRPDDPLLVQLAERVAIRFALESYDRGDVKTNAVVELLDRLKHEIGTLRDILKAQEEKMGRAGMNVESHADILDRQFWARVPDKTKRKMLLSSEAWAVPPRNVRQFVDDLLGTGDGDSARAILDNYAQCVHSPDADARRKASAGLAEMADLFGKANHTLLQDSLRVMGVALGRESNADLQTVMGASFVRFSHEAAARREYPAVNVALQAMENLEQQQPGLARILWPRVKVGNPLPDFIDEALRASNLPPGLGEVLRRMPVAAVDQVASRVQRCARREEFARLLEMAQAVGPEAVSHLRKTLQSRPAAEAAAKVALLSRLAPGDLQEVLPSRLRDWDGPAHDLVVRQIAAGLAPQRGKLLDQVYDLLDRSVLPEVVDELGMAGDPASSPRLMRILEKEAADLADPYLEIKAIEALGRLRESKAEALLRPLAESKGLWRWKHPREVRITALQALRKIDPEWADQFLPRCGLSDSDLKLTALDPEPGNPWLRQRRYERVSPPQPAIGTVRTGQTDHPIDLQKLSMGGGWGRCQCHIKPGSTVPFEFRTGVSKIRAQVLVREARPQELSFEMTQIDHQSRSRLRRPLTAWSAQQGATAVSAAIPPATPPSSSAAPPA